jgi:hypothetical protein
MRVDDLLTTDRYPTAPSEAFVRYFPQPRFWTVKGKDKTMFGGYPFVLKGSEFTSRLPLSRSASNT